MSGKLVGPDFHFRGPLLFECLNALAWDSGISLGGIKYLSAVSLCEYLQIYALRMFFNGVLLRIFKTSSYPRFLMDVVFLNGVPL